MPNVVKTTPRTRASPSPNCIPDPADTHVTFVIVMANKIENIVVIIMPESQ